MVHNHSVFDSDTHFSINNVSRQIRNDSSRKTTLIQHDHNSERFTFECPRYIEGHDMSLCNKVEVHFLNIDAQTKKQHSGLYTVDDLRISPDNEDIVLCSWLVSQNATQYAGSLAFLIRYCCTDNGLITYAWNTAVYTGVSVSSGIDAAGLFETEYVDIIEQWKEAVMLTFETDLANWKQETETEIRDSAARKIAENYGEWGAELDVERKRIDQFVALKDGSTTGDAELQDIRVGVNGEIYACAGDAIRRQAEQHEHLSTATLGYVDQMVTWKNGNFRSNGVSNRIVTQMCVAKGAIALFAPEGFHIALGVYEEAEGEYEVVFDSGWHESYSAPYGAGTIYRVLLGKLDDADIDPSHGVGVIIREYYDTENHNSRIDALERGMTSVDARFVATRNIFTGATEWINANINANIGGVLEPYNNNPEYAAVPVYMPIQAGEYVASWGNVKVSAINLYLHFYDADKNFIERQALYNIYSNGHRVFTAPENAAFYRVAIYSVVSETWDDNIPVDLQIESGNTPSNYIGSMALNPDNIDAEELASMLAAFQPKSIVSATIRSIAHRGEPLDSPQCTKPAYIAAKKIGFSVAENDLFNSADGALVMWHDATLARLGYNLKDINGYFMYSDGANVYYHDATSNVLYTHDAANGYVKSNTNISTLTAMSGANYSVQDLPLEVLKRIDFGAYMGEKYVGTQILTFAEWVKLCKWLGLEIYIDKKIALTESIVSEMAQAVIKSGMRDHASWFCWDMNEAALIRKKIPDARIVWLDAPTASKIESRKSLLNGGAVVFNPHTLELTEENTAAALEAGYEVECWNVDYPNYGLNTKEAIFAEIMRTCCLGVGGVTLDKYMIEDVIQANI